MGWKFKGWELKPRIWRRDQSLPIIFLLIGSPELLALSAVLLMIAFQIRKKAFLYLGAPFDTACANALACAPAHLGLSPGQVFLVLLCVLTAVSVWKSPRFRHFFLIALGEVICLAGILILIAFAQVKGLGNWQVILAIGLTKACAFLAYSYKIEKIAVVPAPIAEPPLKAESLEASYALPAAWATMALFAIVLLGNSSHNLSSPKPTGSESRYPSAMPMPAKIADWFEALDQKNYAKVEAYLANESTAYVFQDPNWGKSLFYNVTESSPEILEAVLRKAALPKEIVAHSFARLASQKNCRAFARLARYARDHHLERSPASLACKP